ncbi:MAG: hypothetical protein ABI959_08115 [Candidatus Dormiibacterota bacterium]
MGQPPRNLMAQPKGVCGTTIGMASRTQASPPIDGIYVDQPWLLMRWDKAHAAVHSEWLGFANTAELRAGLLKGIEAIKDHHARGYLTDTRKVRVVVHDDQEWIKKTWLPLAIEAGLKRIAVVIATEGLGKLTVEDVVGLTDDQGLVSRTFESVDAAWRWIAEVPKTG